MLGFILFSLGVLSLVVSLVGARFTFLRFIDLAGPLGSFLIKICMIGIGIVFVAFSRSLRIEDESKAPK